MKKIGAGLDFGNSNTTLALYDGEGIEYLKIDTALKKGSVMPSALYIHKNREFETGSRALLRYLEENTNRKIRLSEVEVGTIEVHMGEMDRDYFIERDRSFTARLHARIDKDQPGRLFRGLKMYLGESEDKRFKIFNKLFRLEALLNMMLRPVREHWEEKGLSLQSIHVGRPVRYQGSSDREGHQAVGRMKNALDLARFPEALFLEEPVAAAWSYLDDHRLKNSDTLLVFDFGGGTLDLALLKKNSQKGFQVLGCEGITRAGDWIDRELYRRYVFPLLGAGESIPYRKDDGTRSTYPFPFSDFEELLLNWQSTHLLNQSRYLEVLNKALLCEGEVGEKADRLNRLIRCNGSFTLIKLIEQAKKELSEKEKTAIVYPEINLELLLTRDHLNEAIKPFLTEIPELIDTLLERCGIEKVDRVVSTGGSSLIPGIRQTLEQRFPGAVEEWDPFRSIAAGLAMADYYS
ncbi:MAG: Hsp70 family protein [Spirochaetales bacterium]|nr:Hsp70 family protein [Spirochaetales bacterium]